MLESPLSEIFELGLIRLRVVLATAEATVLEAEIAPGGGSSFHVHTKEDETVLVTEGELVVRDPDPHVVRHGNARVLPRGRRHAFANEGDAAVRVYFFCSPGGLERFFRDLTTNIAADVAAARAGLIFD
jgi:quercetin dioxygenase-like cupin family protein